MIRSVYLFDITNAYIQNMPAFLNELNPAQRLAAEKLDGPVMVLAGAGSGKTRVLTYRIAHLMSVGVDPFNILALTFTNKAAREMRERIEKIIGSETRNLWMGTFHSVFAKILRNESERINYPYNFAIYDTVDAKNLIKSITKEMGLDDKIYKPGLVYNRISAAKNNLIGPRKYNESPDIQKEDKIMGRGQIGQIYSSYALRCFKSGAMDFDDLLFKTYELLSQHNEVLKKYQSLFKYVLVDEYQDTNYAQYKIIRLLGDKHNNVCVVGDDAQSIYSFRGANIENILNFKKDFPEAEVFKLEQNYRSTKNIVAAANEVIAKNKHQIPKDVWTENDEGERIRVTKTATDNEEGRWVAQEIFEQKMQHQVPNQDFAVLYRTNAQSRSIEESLRKNGIPYKIYGGLSFYQRKEIKDLLAYFRVIINPHDEEALKRIINYPARGIGKTTLDKVIIKSNLEEVSIWQVIANPGKYDSGIGNAAVKRLKEFVAMIVSFNSEMKKKNAYELASTIANQTGILKEHHSDKTPEGISRYENIQELLSGIKQFAQLAIENPGESGENTLDKFMEDVALLTDVDNEKEEDFDKVSLMTIHSAKGLEFPYVFIVGMEENLFPSQMAVNSRTELEEERRLFYVALTRAEKCAYLSYAQTRFKFGQVNYSEPSRFLADIPLDYLEIPGKSVFVKTPINIEPEKKPKIGAPQKLTSVKRAVENVPSPSTVNDQSGNIREGHKVHHMRFGRGVVDEIEGMGSSKKATISFEKHGKKQILLKFAKLKIVG
jgi:DNA helicase-2/ATP-dependent DNA helicase PcrA